MTSTNGWADKQKRLDARGKATSTLTMYDDPDVRDRYLTAKQKAEQADAYLARLPKDADPEARTLVERQVAEAAAELQTAMEEKDAHSVVLTFQALDRQRLEELVAKHPPTEEDEEAGRDFHHDSFAPVLISEASLDEMPLEYAQNAMRTWSLSDSDDLWLAAWTVQRRKRTDLGKG
jgi:hypothetical protein